MKLFYIVLGLGLIGLVFGSFYYTNMRKDVTSFKTTTDNPTPESIHIYREYGDVSFKEKTASAYTQVTDEKMLIPNYSSVKTVDGRGYVIFPDNSTITLSTSTEIEINYTPTKVSILQSLGTTYHRVTTLIKGNTYEVRTPNTLAAIRGTKFAVVYTPTNKKTLVAVTEHSVEVTQTKENGTTLRAPVMVQEGSLAEVKSSTSTTPVGTGASQDGGSVMVRPTTEVPEVQQFIDENKVIDKEYDKTPLNDRKNNLEMLIKSLQKQAATAPSAPSNPTTPVTPETRVTTVTKAISTMKSITPSVPATQDASKTIRETTPTPTAAKTPVTTQTITPTTRATTAVTAPVTQTSATLRALPVSAEELTPTDEAFVDTFYAAYERYFLIDTPTSYCDKIKGMSSRDIITALLAITNKAGVVLPKQTELTAFASDLVNACADGTIANKASTLKTRFDTTYPY